MREARYEPFIDGRLSSEVLLVLHRFAPSEPLLPNLKTLQFSGARTIHPLVSFPRNHPHQYGIP